MSVICKIDNKEFKDEKSLHLALRGYGLNKEKYYHQYYPKKDLLTGINTFLIISSGSRRNSSSTKTFARNPRIFSPLSGIATILPPFICHSN